MTDHINPLIIGRAENIEILDLDLKNVPAKVDTGADTSSIWTSKAEEKSGQLHCIFFGPGSDFYSGETVIFSKDYKLTRVANSFGQKELRYKVKLRIRVNERLIRATFTLSDRSSKTYPVLLGRRLLKGKFLVDVSQGKPQQEKEKAKRKKLEKELKTLTGKKEKS